MYLDEPLDRSFVSCFSIAQDGLEVEEEFARCFTEGLGGEARPELSERLEEQESLKGEIYVVGLLRSTNDLYKRHIYNYIYIYICMYIYIYMLLVYKGLHSISDLYLSIDMMCIRRVRKGRQDQRLDQILTIVDALADKVSDTGASVQALEARSSDQSSVIHEEIRDKAPSFLNR